MCSLEKRGRVFVLTLTGDGEHRLGHEMIDSLREALARARSESQRGYALLTVADGSRFFSNGFDLAWAQSGGSHLAFLDRLGSLVLRFAPLILDLLSLPMPTVAAITGHAAAAGFLLAVSHDYRLMRADRGVIYMSEVDIGLPFPDYFAELLRAKIADPAALRDVALGAKKIGGTEASARGIVDRAVAGEAGETIKAAMGLAEELAARNWDGAIYASVRLQMFPDAVRVVNSAAEKAEKEEKDAQSKL